MNQHKPKTLIRILVVNIHTVVFILTDHKTGNMFLAHVANKVGVSLGEKEDNSNDIVCVITTLLACLVWRKIGETMSVQRNEFENETQQIIFDLSFKGKTQQFYSPLGPLFQNPTHGEWDWGLKKTWFVFLSTCLSTLHWWWHTTQIHRTLRILTAYSCTWIPL